MVDGVMVLVLTGRLGVASSRPVIQAVAAQLAAGNRYIVIDLQGIDYVSSAGIGALLRASADVRAAGGVLVVTGICESVSLTLELSGRLTELLREPTRELAVARARR